MKKSLLESWSSACLIFSKDQRRLFLLATLNNAIKIFCRETGIFALGVMLLLIAGRAPLTLNVWGPVFSLFSWKSLLFVKIFGPQEGMLFYAGMLPFSLALCILARPCIERKDADYLLRMLFWYAPFFLVTQEIVLLLPYCAFIFMDMKNRPMSVIHALTATGKLVVYHLPVIAGFLVGYGILLHAGFWMVRGMIALGLSNPFWGASMLPLAWFTLVHLLYISASALYYTKVKHTDRELLFGKQ